MTQATRERMKNKAKKEKYKAIRELQYKYRPNEYHHALYELTRLRIRSETILRYIISPNKYFREIAKERLELEESWNTTSLETSQATTIRS